MNKDALWTATCEVISKEIGEIACKTWIVSPIKPIELKDDTFYFEALTNFYKTFVESHYAVLIANTLSQVAQKNIKLKIMTPEETVEFKKVSTSNPVNSSISMLNPRYTFESYVVGSNNRLAHAASLAVSQSPAQAYNPLFIYGGAGLGKTHLMHAIGHYILSQKPDATIVYTTTEMFTNELITAIQAHKNAEFRERYRNVDLLLVDDIQFLSKAERTQEEFFHTFNALHSAGKQIVITSDKPPKEIPRLEERMSSRFQWGMIADISKPDFETRVAILKQRAKEEMITTTDDVLRLIAEHVQSNIRELEGCLTRLSAYSSLTNRPIDVELAQEALHDSFQRVQPRSINGDNILEEVARYYTIPVEDLKGPRRSREITIPRHIAMYLCRELADLSFPRIGETFNRDHSTVQHACEKIGIDIKTNQAIASAVSDITRQIKER